MTSKRSYHFTGRYYSPAAWGAAIGIAGISLLMAQGTGLGASKTLKIAAFSLQDMIFPGALNEYMGKYAWQLLDEQVIFIVAAIAAALFYSWMKRDVGLVVLRGPRMSPLGRLTYALPGGILVGFGAALAHGCTSGLALMGGMTGIVGAYLFMFSVFGGGFAAAWFARHEWLGVRHVDPPPRSSRGPKWLQRAHMTVVILMAVGLLVSALFFADTGLVKHSGVVAGLVFGTAIAGAGMMDPRRIAGTFYAQSTEVPAVMFSAIITGSILLSVMLAFGVVTMGEVHWLPTYYVPMVLGGLIFGVGMVLSGYCPGTATLASAVGRVDAIVSVVGMLVGILLFGNLKEVVFSLPLWGHSVTFSLGELYRAGFMEVYQLPDLLRTNGGATPLTVIVLALGIMGFLLFVQHRAHGHHEHHPLFHKFDPPVLAAAALVAIGLTFAPNSAFLKPHGDPGYYIIPQSSAAQAHRQELAPPPDKVTESEAE